MAKTLKKNESFSKKIICSCFDISVHDMATVISKNQSMSYGEFLNITGATKKCAACSLDVEYHFTKLINSNLPKTLDENNFVGKNITKVPIKQRIYGFLDSMTPMSSMMRGNYIPIIGKKNLLTSWIWISNFSMMYEGIIKGSRMDIELIVRNYLGETVHKKKYLLGYEEFLRIDVSQFLYKDSLTKGHDFFVGSLEINRLPLEVGLRGTTRPQLEVVANDGCGAVHTQGKSKTENGGLSCFYNPDIERIFIAVINLEKYKENIFRIVYPENSLEENDTVEECIKIPPMETIFYELKLPDEVKKKYLKQLIQVKWSLSGVKSTFVFCTSLNFNQISVDHVQ